MKAIIRQPNILGGIIPSTGPIQIQSLVNSLSCSVVLSRDVSLLLLGTVVSWTTVFNALYNIKNNRT